MSDFDHFPGNKTGLDSLLGKGRVGQIRNTSLTTVVRLVYTKANYTATN